MPSQLYSLNSINNFVLGLHPSGWEPLIYAYWKCAFYTVEIVCITFPNIAMVWSLKVSRPENLIKQETVAHWEISVKESKGRNPAVTTFPSFLCLFLKFRPVSFMAVFFSGSHILLHHFHLLCLWGFDPQYSRLSYTHALQGEPVGIVPNGNLILVESFLSPLKKLLSLVTEFSKDAEQKVTHKDTILCSFNESNLLPLHSLKDTLLDNGALLKPSSIKGVTLWMRLKGEKSVNAPRGWPVYIWPFCTDEISTSFGLIFWCFLFMNGLKAAHCEKE